MGKFILLAGILSIVLFCFCNSSGKDMKGIYSSEAEKNKLKENAESTGEKPDTGVQPEIG